MLRMNLGCGPVQPDGWVNVDPDPQWRAPYRTLNRFDNNKFDLVVANHVLMMIPWPELLEATRTIRQALKSGGVFRIIEPDFVGAFEAYLAGNKDHFPISDAMSPSADGKLCLYVSQAGATRSVFTTRWLIELCERAGFQSAVEVGPGYTTAEPELDATALDTRESESIFVEARK